MSTQQSSTFAANHKDTGIVSYSIGFGLSLILTSGAFLLVEQHNLNRGLIVGLIVGLALIQLIIQLVFFLHLNRETKPRWNLFVFMFMLLVLSILVIGSLWIMNHLDYSMAKPSQLDNSIRKDEGIGS